jgi:aryl-alcohol dehydrogenase-like predicted oxidoreductase
LPLAKLRDEGKIRNIGVSNFNVDQMRRARMVAPITSLQPPYSLVATDVEDVILPYTFMRQIGVIVYSPMGSGLLTGAMTWERIAAMPADDWRKDSPNFREPLLTRNLELVERLARWGRRITQAPGKWLLRGL